MRRMLLWVAHVCLVIGALWVTKLPQYLGQRNQEIEAEMVPREEARKIISAYVIEQDSLLALAREHIQSSCYFFSEHVVISKRISEMWEDPRVRYRINVWAELPEEAQYFFRAGKLPHDVQRYISEKMRAFPDERDEAFFRDAQEYQGQTKITSNETKEAWISFKRGLVWLFGYLWYLYLALWPFFVCLSLLTKIRRPKKILPIQLNCFGSFLLRSVVYPWYVWRLNRGRIVVRQYKKTARSVFSEADQELLRKVAAGLSIQNLRQELTDRGDVRRRWLITATALTLLFLFLPSLQANANAYSTGQNIVLVVEQGDNAPPGFDFELRQLAIVPAGIICSFLGKFTYKIDWRQSFWRKVYLEVLGPPPRFGEAF